MTELKKEPNLEAIQKSLEIIFQRLEILEDRANGFERTDGNQDNIIGQIRDGFKQWKEQNNRIKEATNSKIQDLDDALKLNNEGDKAQSNQIAALEDSITKIVRQLENIRDVINDGDEKEWPLSRIRSTLRNSAFTARLIQGFAGVVGLSGIGIVASAVFGWGQDTDIEFTELSEHKVLQQRVYNLELNLAGETSKWDVIYQNLDIEVGQQDD